MNPYPFSQQEWETCLRVLTALKDDPLNNPDNQQFKTLITAIHKKAKKDIRNASSEARQAEDFAKMAQTHIVSKAQNNTTLYAHEAIPTQPYTVLHQAVPCYACGEMYTQLHFFYHRLCPACAETNYRFRDLELDFSSHQVLITGGRVKIGYATALKFLRAGANVLVTSRFPGLAWEQFAKETDFSVWQNRLTMYGLDLRNIKAVYQFVDYCKQSLTSLDILINNAAQTIKYPLEYYRPLIAKEKQNLLHFQNTRLLGNSTPISLQQGQLLELNGSVEVPLNRFGQPVDYRDKNSWNSTLVEIGLEELLEVNLINQISPYLLISELKPLIETSIHPDRFIVNVTSSEGQFSYVNKTVHHPHTNMTKAALNMLTRTSAADFVTSHIYMNSVDVGWISTGAHEEKRARLFDNHRIPPLDSVDGAMRIIHPILEIQKGNKELYGKLFKNYTEVNW